MDILIRDVPADLHAELQRRANENDMSLRAYLRSVLAAHTATPSMAQWLDRVATLEPVATDGLSGAALVAAARVDDDEPRR